MIILIKIDTDGNPTGVYFGPYDAKEMDEERLASMGLVRPVYKFPSESAWDCYRSHVHTSADGKRSFK